MLQGSGTGHQLSVTAKTFKSGKKHHFLVKIETLDDKHQKGCLGVGIVRAASALETTPQGRDGCYKCVLCGRWGDQMELSTTVTKNRSNTQQDFRCKFDKNTIIQAVLDLTPGAHTAFEVEVKGGGNNKYVAVP